MLVIQKLIIKEYKNYLSLSAEITNQWKTYYRTYQTYTKNGNTKNHTMSTELITCVNLITSYYYS
jgi:hypothetical protein